MIYRPATLGQGVFYLGFQPRDYFEDPGASGPVDLDAEAYGIAAWAGRVLGNDVGPEDVRPLLADDSVTEPKDDFVELTVERLFGLLNPPLPPKFPASS